MADKTNSDEIDVLDPEWNRAWGQLRSAGYSDDEIWTMASNVEDESWPEDPPPGEEKEHYYAELISYISNLRDRVLNEAHPPSVWIEAGILVSILRSLAGHDDQVREDFSRRQKIISRLPKNRAPSVAKLVVEHVLNTSPPGERTYSFFEEYIGSDRIVTIDDLEIGVIVTSNNNGTAIRYGFEKPGAREPIWLVQSSIRSIISRLNNGN